MEFESAVISLVMSCVVLDNLEALIFFLERYSIANNSRTISNATPSIAAIAMRAIKAGDKDLLGERVDSLVGVDVGTVVRMEVGSGVRVEVGSGVRVEVGTVLRMEVGSGVRVEVGSGVRVEVG